MDIKTATSRLRRTFAYPSDTTTPSSSRHLSDIDDDDLDGRNALDEQEQEDLIRALVEQNAARNAQFRLFLLALPTLSAVPYVAAIFGVISNIITSTHPGGKGRAADIWIALLSLSSLAATAWTLWSLPPGVTGIRALDAWVGSGDSSSSSNSNGLSPSSPSNDTPTFLSLGANAHRRRTSSASFWVQHRSPLQQYLPFLNIVLCALLVVAGALASSSSTPRGAGRNNWGHVGLANLPAVVYAVVILAKSLMGSIDPERELNALRYEYKGA